MTRCVINEIVTQRVIVVNILTFLRSCAGLEDSGVGEFPSPANDIPCVLSRLYTSRNNKDYQLSNGRLQLGHKLSFCRKTKPQFGHDRGWDLPKGAPHAIQLGSPTGFAVSQ